LQASFSRGIVSQSLREIEGMTFIQLDAAISTGSSGGALLDARGKVVGVTTAMMYDSQNINLAVPIDFFTELSSDSWAPLESILMTRAFYAGLYPAPDFGAQFSVIPFDTGPWIGGTSFSYRLDELPGDADEIIDEYMHLVAQNLFIHVGTSTTAGVVLQRYHNTKHGITLTLGPEVVRGRECFTVNVRGGES
jgi:hypothetical protein